MLGVGWEDHCTGSVSQPNINITIQMEKWILQFAGWKVNSPDSWFFLSSVSLPFLNAFIWPRAIYLLIYLFIYVLSKSNFAREMCMNAAVGSAGLIWKTKHWTSCRFTALPAHRRNSLSALVAALLWVRLATTVQTPALIFRLDSLWVSQGCYSTRAAIQALALTDKHRAADCVGSRGWREERERHLPSSWPRSSCGFSFCPETLLHVAAGDLDKREFGSGHVVWRAMLCPIVATARQLWYEQKAHT